MKEHGLEVEPDEEEFGFGKLLIDYKPPKKSTSKISNKGTCKLFIITHGLVDNKAPITTKAKRQRVFAKLCSS